MLYELYLFDREENLLEIITEYEEFKYIKELNSIRSLSFEVNKNNNIKKYNKVGFFDKDKKFQLFFINNLTSFKDNETEKITVDCLADFYSLGNTIIDDKRATNIKEAIIKTLEETDYKLGIVESFEDRNINFYHISRIKALNEIINTFKCEIDIRIEINETTGKIANKFIDFKHRLGNDTGIRFTYDTALENVEKTVLDGHFNVLWGWGKSLETDSGGFSRKLDFASINNGKKYVEDTESIKKYGRLEGIFEDGNIDDKIVLLERTEEKLQETKNLKISYKASIKDLSNNIKYKHYKVQLGDSIIILDEEIDEVIETRIIGIEETEDETLLTLGNFLLALSDDNIEDILGNLNNKIDNLPKPDIPTIDTIFPDVLPNVPTVEVNGLFSSVIITWTYENKSYYTYEVFASKIKDFNPSTANRIFEGKASSFLHEVKPDETWYYRVRVKNTHDKFTSYSAQVKATTKKISDGTQYFEELAIGHALIASLDLDKATVGKLKAQFLDVYNLLVTDGNGKKTLEIDSFGNINLDVSKLKVNSTDIESAIRTLTEFKQNSEDFQFKVVKSGINNLVKNSSFEIADGVITGKSAAVTQFLITNRVNEITPKDSKQMLFIEAGKGGDAYVHTSLVFEAIAGETYTISVDTRFASLGSITSSSSYINLNGEYYHILNNDNFSYNWHRVTTTWTAPKQGVAQLRFGFRSSDYSWGAYDNVKVEKGRIATPWCGAANEISEGITSINDKGVTVKHSSGSSASFNHDGSIWRDNLGREGIKINNGGIAFIDVSNGEWTNFMRTSYKSDGSGMNGLTISTSNLGDFIGIGCSNVSNIDGDWYSSSALTIENYDGKHGLSGLHFWSMTNMSRNESYLHNHTNYIQESGNIYMNDRPIIFDGFGSETSNWIGRSASDRGRLCIFADNVLALGYRRGTENYGALEIHESDGFHSYRNWDFNNWTMYNMRTTYSISNSRTRKYTEAHGLKSDEDSLRYVYKKMQFKNNKLILSIPNAYVGCNYTILNIVKYGKGDVWISEENENGFILESDNDIKVNIEIDITNIENVSNFERKISGNHYSRNTDDKLESFETMTEDIIPYWKLYKNRREK